MRPFLKILLFVCIATVTLIGVFFVVTQDARTARHELEAKLARETKALERRDAETILNGILPDATVTDLRGKVRTHADIEKNLRLNMAGFSAIQAESKIDTLTLHGDSATETVTLVLNGTYRDRQNRSHTVTETNTSRVVLRRTQQGWKTASSTVLSESLSLDGKNRPLPR